MIDDIIQNIEHYLSLQRFDGDKTFNQQLLQLQDWQHQRMLQSYGVLLDSEPHGQLLEFFLGDIYKGVDLSAVAGKLSKTAKLMDKLFTDLEMVHIAIEFNTLTGQLDEAMTRQLFGVMAVEQITEENYAEAFRLLGEAAGRQRQLTLIDAFAREAQEVIEDAFVYNAFKLAKYPAKLGGLGDLYGLISRGFKIIRKVPDTYPIVREIVHHESAIYDAIYTGSMAPFVPLPSLQLAD